MHKVGSQCVMYKTIYHSILVHIHRMQNLPCQMSILKPLTYLRNAQDCINAKELILKNNMSVFDHSNVCFNPSNPNDSAMQDVQISLKLVDNFGGKGVVIHVGKHCDRTSVSEAIDIMRKSIEKILQYASETSPLILETPAGQGTELLTTIEEFTDFYLSFTQEDREKFKICVDTQHVFGAGYDPLEYIQSLVNKCGIQSLVLVHMNDSKVEIGSKLDRHERIGCGKIGAQKLNLVAEFLDLHSIPAVFE